MTRRLITTFSIVWSLLALMSGAATAQTSVEIYHTDPIGSVRHITNDAGNVVETYDYSPFGETAAPEPFARQFAGKERDPDTGFDYFGGRFYAASLGRFSTVDPAYVIDENLHNPQLFNRYSYAVNNPLRFTDPDGRLWETVWDAYSLAAGIASFRSNWRSGSYGSAALDAVGIAVDGLAVATPIMPGGVGAAIRASRSSLHTATSLQTASSLASARPLVIGEGMERVTAYASKRGMDVYGGMPGFRPGIDDAAGLAHNRQAIEAAMAQGRRVVDIGPDFGRRAVAGASKAYEMERTVTSGYTGYSKAFTRSGKTTTVR